jgi:uncharacterized protein (TIGR03382 family)
MKATIMKTIGTTLLLAGMAGLLVAQNCIQGLNCVSAPEIDGATASSALALLGGVVVMIRARKK